MKIEECDVCERQERAPYQSNGHLAWAGSIIVDETRITHNMGLMRKKGPDTFVHGRTDDPILGLNLW